jgi:hypothetical protein
LIITLYIGFWNDLKSQKAYLEWLGTQLGIKSPEDWYKVSSKELQIFGCYEQIRKHGGLKVLIPRVFPEHNWNAYKFTQVKFKSSQNWLSRTVKELFPNTGTVTDN